MRDVRDWNKYVDLLGKSVVRQPSIPVSPEIDAPNMPSPDAQAQRARPEPPRKGRGPRREETREELLARLLDPVLTLEETARILQVCPTTVRRYTNKGLLPHERSAGNQRRFRWSQVYAFMEAQGGGAAAPDAE